MADKLLLLKRKNLKVVAEEIRESISEVSEEYGNNWFIIPNIASKEYAVHINYYPSRFKIGFFGLEFSTDDLLYISIISNREINPQLDKIIKRYEFREVRI